MKYGKIGNYINGEFCSSSKETLLVENPQTAQTIAEVALATKEDVDFAVVKAKEAQKEWANLNYKQRSIYFYNYLQLLNKYRDELANCVKEENGKDLVDANAEVDKAIELCEFTCSIPQLPLTTTLEVSSGIVCKEEKRALGVVASIAPFNFPIMVPHWTILNAIMMGNAIILKPSETTPITAMKIAQMFKEAGFPDGIFNIINGAKEAVESICDNEDIKAVSFVGSTPVAKIVYKRASSNLKRALCLGGAKNFLILTPDAQPSMAVRDIVASFSGMNGQRCMAGSVLVTVGDCKEIVNEIVLKVKDILKDENLAPVINKNAVTTLENYLKEAKKNGAEILVDGSTYSTTKAGYFFAPSIIDYGETVNFKEEEIFGPILEIVHVDTLDEAIKLQNSSPYGNGSAVFTQNGKVSEDVIKGLQAGMLGVNIGIPVPREPFSFGGIKESKFGYGDITGKSSLDFWSNLVKVTTKYSAQNKIDWMS